MSICLKHCIRQQISTPTLLSPLSLRPFVLLRLLRQDFRYNHVSRALISTPPARRGSGSAVIRPAGFRFHVISNVVKVENWETEET